MCSPRIHGLWARTLYASLAVPPVPVRIPCPECHIRNICRLMMQVIMRRYLTAEENPWKPQLGDRLMKALLSVFASKNVDRRACQGGSRKERRKGSMCSQMIEAESRPNMARVICSRCRLWVTGKCSAHSAAGCASFNLVHLLKSNIFCYVIEAWWWMSILG